MTETDQANLEQIIEHPMSRLGVQSLCKGILHIHTFRLFQESPSFVFAIAKSRPGSA